MNIKYREAIRDAIREEMIKDPSIFMMGEDIGLCGGCSGVPKDYSRNSVLTGSGTLRFQRRPRLVRE